MLLSFNCYIGLSIITYGNLAVVVRLREIIRQLSDDQSCSKDDLIETLQYAAMVAENIYVIEIKCAHLYCLFVWTPAQ